MASANAEKDALEIIREHYADICKQISDPLSLAQDLYQAKVISESCLSEVETDGLVNSKRITIIMKHVRTVVRSSGAKLKDFAVVLQRYPETEAKGVKLLLTCNEKFGEKYNTATENSRYAKIESIIEDPDIQKILVKGLDIDDIADVLVKLKDYNNWDDLGIQLGLSQAMIERIQKDKPDTVSRRHQMVACWLRDTKEPTYKQLLNALRKLDHYDAVEIVVKKLLENKNKNLS